MFAYGFEDLTSAQWSLLEALAGRADVQVSLPYEPGREVFASLQRTADDLSALAAGRIEELPPRSTEYAHPALAHLERSLFRESPPAPPEIDGAVRFFEGAGPRGTLELIGEEMLGLLRAGTPAEQIALVAPALDGWRAPLETVLGGLGVPYSFESRVRLGNDAVRARAAAAAALRLDGRDAARAVRVPPLAVLGPRALVRRLRRGTPARPRDPHARRASRRRPRSCARRPFPRSASCARPSRRSPARAS